jgi:hypothetical protein
MLKKSIRYNRDYFPKLDHVIHIFLVYGVVTTSTIIQSSWKKPNFRFHQKDMVIYHSELMNRKFVTPMDLWKFDVSPTDGFQSDNFHKRDNPNRLDHQPPKQTNRFQAKSKDFQPFP